MYLQILPSHEVVASFKMNTYLFKKSTLLRNKCVHLENPVRKENKQDNTCNSY